ncbi:putative ABC transporter permease [Lacticaseibacillus nasuensis]|nr:putative ABC transporter permease [Lacticaseibacillus nasuensis]
MLITLTLVPVAHQVTTWLLYFFAYAFIGWLWESGYVSLRKHQWVNSGFLIGPIIPVYGFSMIAVLALVGPVEDQLPLLYLVSALVVTVIEYVTSWLLEVLFHARWWDYSHVPLNLNGRVALPISACWGLGVVLIVKLVQPLVHHWAAATIAASGDLVAVLLLAATTFDLGFTLANMLAFGAATQRIGEEIEARKQKLQAQVDANLAWLDSYRATDTKLPPLNYVQRRVLKSFPHLRLTNTHTPAEDIAKLSDLLKQRRRP